MKNFLSIKKLFPIQLRSELERLTADTHAAPEEIRVRVGKPLTLRRCGSEVFGTKEVTKSDMLYLIGSAADCSYHAVVRQMKNGYIPLQGGCRMGLCGCGNGADGELRSMDEVNSLCIRIASERVGCADAVWEEWMRDGFRNTVIIAPPGAGKTTLLRELIRKLSVAGYYVGVADEREELSGRYHGQAAFELGPRSDVLTGISKNDAAMMLLRSMAPDIIAMDEITAFADQTAIREAVGCGVGLLTTIHGDGVQSLRKPAFTALYEAEVFEKAILVSIKQGKRCYEVVDLYA